MSPRHAEDSPSLAADRGGSANNIRIDLGGTTLAVVIVLVSVIAGCGAIMGLNLAKQSQMDASFKELKTQEWLLERRLMDREALDIVNGIKKPSDDAWGATGNLQRMKPKRTPK